MRKKETMFYQKSLVMTLAQCGLQPAVTMRPAGLCLNTFHPCAPVALLGLGAISAADYDLLTPPLPTGSEVRPIADFCADVDRLAETGTFGQKNVAKQASPAIAGFVKTSPWTPRVAPELIERTAAAPEVRNPESLAKMYTKRVAAAGIKREEEAALVPKRKVDLAELKKITGELPFIIAVPWGKECAGTVVTKAKSANPQAEYYLNAIAASQAALIVLCATPAAACG